MSKSPATSESPAPYSLLQIRLHWAVVVLLAGQFLLKGSMVDTMTTVRAGDTPAIGAYLLANLHLLCGFVVGFLMAYRLYLRFGNASQVAAQTPVVATTVDDLARSGRSGRSGKSPLMRIAPQMAGVVHGLFYLLLLTMPLSGLSAWYEMPGAAILHGWQKNLLLFLLLLHVAAALIHLWVLRDRVFQRMLRLF